MVIAMRLASLALLLTLVAPAVQADHWRQTADPQLITAIDYMVSTYGQYCQGGMQMACQLQAEASQVGYAALNASYDCMAMGNPMACDYYQQAGWSLINSAQGLYQTMTGGTAQTMPAPGYDPGNVLGPTHDARMANIEAWGTQNTINWQNSQATIDANHDAFIAQIQQ